MLMPVIMDPWESERVCDCLKLPIAEGGLSKPYVEFDPKEFGTKIIPVRMIKPQRHPWGAKQRTGPAEIAGWWQRPRS